MWNYFEFKSVVQEMPLTVFLIWSSGCPFVLTAERKHLCNFRRGYQEEQFCERF